MREGCGRDAGLVREGCGKDTGGMWHEGVNRTDTAPLEPSSVAT